ncbi:cobalamin-dependent protein [Clostridium swellfunianum]|uniref:cobalamin B12-binding domain-containing protein n=1 Tax=Clostridium swellfunianum TaxID=1367462 RepID=UPI00202F210D|nr:cobalamin-dependent protein [Clostridium swellfunianum]MCM0647192.1 cobalamin-dependent protein [Clostridium swellfunianum]
MHHYYNEFMKTIETENRNALLNFILPKLKNNEIDIITLYTEILAPSLNSMVQNKTDKAFIWREHVRSSIIRTIIENCYPYVIKERDESYKLNINKKIAVVCPSEEYHEIGARMITDFFTLLGYNATFVGSNTPKEEFLEALQNIKLDYIAISVSNPYSLIAARKAIEKIREADPKIKILVGGSAFKHKEHSHKEIGADMYLHSFEDIKKLAEEDGQ